MTTPVSISTTDAEPHPGDPGFRHGLLSRLAAEAFGALFLVVAGLGVPLFTLPQSNPLPAALAAGLAVTAAMLAFAYVSGGHFNPAITLGNLVAGRIRAGHAAAYVCAQLAGAAAGALALFGVLRTIPTIPDTRAAFDTVTAGFGEHSVIQASMAGVLLAEVLGAALLVAIFLGTTARRNVHAAAAPFAVGLSLAVLLQFGQAIGNAPFNPARATASALFSNSWSLGQLWLFWIAPLVGAAIAGLVFRGFSDSTAGKPATGTDDGVDDVADSDVADGGEEATAETVIDTSDSGTSDSHTSDSDTSDSKAPGRSASPEARPATAPDEARDFFDGPGRQ
jgi:aquaporin Z